MPYKRSTRFGTINKKKMMIIIGIALLVLILLGGGYMFYSKKSSFVEPEWVEATLEQAEDYCGVGKTETKEIDGVSFYRCRREQPDPNPTNPYEISNDNSLAPTDPCDPCGKLKAYGQAGPTNPYNDPYRMGLLTNPYVRTDDYISVFGNPGTQGLPTNPYGQAGPTNPYGQV